MNNYKPVETVFEMSCHNFVWAIIGVILGIVLNNISVKLFKLANITNKMSQNVLQIMLCSILLSQIHINMNNYFGWSWQNINPGLFFISFFFGMQFKLFANLSEYAADDSV